MSKEIRPQQKTLNNQELEEKILEVHKDISIMNQKIEVIYKKFHRLLFEIDSFLTSIQRRFKL